MGSLVNSLIGGVSGNTGGAGMNYQAGQADVINPYGNAANAQAVAGQQQGNVNTGLSQQQNFLNAVQAQGGLQNQSNVFGQLQGVANGTGPNPAQAQLAQATGANTANQAALMAGQRGGAANAGLIARQAGQQGAANQQAAAGQAATMQAQQSLGALNQMGGLATNQANQQAGATQAYSQQAQGAQQNALQGIQGINTANVGSMSSQNAANAGVAGQIAGAQNGVIGSILNGIGGVSNVSSGLFPGAGNALPGAGNALPATANTWGDIAAGAGDALGGAAAGGAGDAMMLAYKGGMVGYATGGNVANSTISTPTIPLPQSNFAKAMAVMSSGISNQNKQYQMSHYGISKFNAAEGGKVPAMVSPGEQYIPPKDMKKVAAGANPLSTGERIPGKPKHPGNDYRNDVVPKTLESGGIVIPNKVMQSKDPANEARRFVAAHMKQSALKGRK